MPTTRYFAATDGTRTYYAAGRAAGDRVNLSRPVGGAAQGRIAS